jgi:hypothetical protein
MIEQLDVPLEIHGVAFWVRMHELATVRRKLLGDFVVRADRLDWHIGKALDMLLFGP